MATHDYILANASGAAFRTDLNNALAAIVSNNSNSSSPATTYAYQWWADTSAGVLKIRNSANNAWIELLQLDGTLTLEPGSASTPALAFRADLNTGIFSSGDDAFDIATAGSQRLHINSSGFVGIGTATPQRIVHSSAGSSDNCILATSSAGNAFIGFADSGTTNQTGLSVRMGSSGDSLVFQTGGTNERLRIDSSGRIAIGNSSPSVTLDIEAVTPTIRLTDSDASGTPECEISGGGGDLLFSADRDNENSSTIQSFKTDGTERMRITSSAFFVYSVHSQTTSAGANVNVQSNGNIVRSTSSIRYKKDITDATWGLTEVLKLKPKTFKNNATGEDADEKIYGGFTAEDVHDLGLTEFVEYDKDNQPDALFYGNMVALMAKAIQDLNGKVETLETKVAALEAG